MQTPTLTGGFANPAVDAAHAFRAIMEATARPGSIHKVQGVLPPAPISVAAGAVILTLCDTTTPLHLAGRFDRAPIRDWIAFQTGAPLCPPSEAQFILCDWGDVDLATLPIGTPEYPDRSATLIVERESLAQRGSTLRGPGIKDTAQLNLPETAAFQTNRALFPLGLDFIFTSGPQLAALPRTTEVF